jgi:hypothetical protein
MRPLIILTLSSITFAFASCCGCHGSEDEVVDHGHQHDSLNHEEVVLNENFVDTGGYVNDSAALETEIELKYGVQWDFCDCVVKNDSINKVLESAGDDADYDGILARMEVIDQHCKGLLATPNTTPEQRDRHARKVRKCLKEAGIKLGFISV